MMHSEPSQERSRRSLESILTATEELLDEQTFRSIGVTDIANRAGVAPSLLYTRFGGKDEILPCLTERLLRRYLDVLEAEFSRPVPEASPAACIEWLVDIIERLSRDNVALLRAISERQLDNAPVMEGQIASLNARRLDLMTDWLVESLAKGGLNLSRCRARMAISTLTTMLQTRLLFRASESHLDYAEMRAELCAMISAYVISD